MKIQEWKNDGTKWVLAGTFNDVSEDQIESIVEQWLAVNTKLILIDDEDDYVKEWVA